MPNDLARFKNITMGHPVIMGRKTYDSIVQPLQGRLNIVLTREENPYLPGAVPYRSVNDLIEDLDEGKLQHEGIDTSEVFIIGGQQIYEQTIGLADRLEITEVHREYPGDAVFPEIDKKIWKETERESWPGFDFVSYVRR
ncbi:MAG: dihydrofolate reductase [Candidatus Woesearchaeota archaeon]